MDAFDFFHDVATVNYKVLKKSPDLRLLWNAVVSMNNVAEYLALHRLGYPASVSQSELRDAAEQIRNGHPSLDDLNFCAITFKHVRRIPRSRPSGLTATSTSLSAGDKTTWIIEKDGVLRAFEDVLDRAFEDLSAFPELVAPKNRGGGD